MSMSCVFVCNYIWSVLFQPYFQKTKTPQSLLIRLKMPYPFPTLQSQQQHKNPWWAAKREKQGKPRLPTLSGQQMDGCHQQEVLWVRRGSFTWERTRARWWLSWPHWTAKDHKPTVDPYWKMDLFRGFGHRNIFFLWISLRTSFPQTPKCTKCIRVKIIALFPRAFLERKGNF